MIPTDVTPRLKPDPAACSCGCGVIGQPRARAWHDGLAAHARTCRCRRCEAPRYRQRAAKRERRMAKDLGGQRSPLSGAINGADVVAPFIEIEETANETVVRGIRRWWTSKTVVDKTDRLFARPGDVARALVLTWDGRKRVVVMRYDDLQLLVRMAEES